jgi:hypothetical protein
MKSSIRGVISGAVGLALLVLAGCENNEASVKGGGTVAPGTAASSDDAGKVKPAPSSAPTGYGPAQGRKGPAVKEGDQEKK